MSSCYGRGTLEWRLNVVSENNIVLTFGYRHLKTCFSNFEFLFQNMFVILSLIIGDYYLREFCHNGTACWVRIANKLTFISCSDKQDYYVHLAFMK